MSKELFVSVENLVMLSMGQKLKNGLVHRYCSNETWISDKVGGRRKILYTSIQDWFKEKHGLPLSEIEAGKVIAKKEAALKPNTGIDPEIIEDLYCSMRHEKLNSFHCHSNYLKEHYRLSIEQRTAFAQKWAVYAYIAKTYQDNKRRELETFFAAYSRLYPGEIANKTTFSTKIKICKDGDFETVIIDKRYINKSRKKISAFQQAFIQHLFIQSKKYNPTLIHRKLVEACKEAGENPCHVRTVRDYYNEYTKNIDLYTAKFGETAGKKKLPYLDMLPAEHRNTQICIDGWTLPCWGQGVKNFQRYVLHFAIDNHSWKIVGFSVGISENTELILNTLKDQIDTTGVLGAEYVMDKHAWTKTHVAARFFEISGKMGVVHTVTTNANRNKIAERANQFLDALCVEFPWYIGSINNRLSVEEYEVLRKTKNQLTEEEVQQIAVYLVTEYNRTNRDWLDGLSPNEKYNQSESVKGILMTEADRANLFNLEEEMIVRRGQITIKRGMIRHGFQLPAALYDLYNDRSVKVVHEDLTQGIYLYDVKTNEFIAFIKPKHKISGAVADQTEEDKAMLNKQTGRVHGAKVKAKKRAQAALEEGLKDNPEAIEIMKGCAMPKDIRQLATQDTEVRRAMNERGINPDKVPIRNIKPAKEVVTVTKSGKSYDSPFTNPNHKIRKVSIEEILGLTNEQ